MNKVNFLLHDSEAVEGQVAMGSAGTEAKAVKTKEFTNYNALHE